MRASPWKKVWIVGASTGLGKELAIQLDHMGCQVYLSARSKAKLEKLSQNFSNSKVIPLDISDKIKVENTVNGVMERQEALPDLIILNAAIYDPMTSNNLDPQKVREMMEVNFLGNVNLINALLKHTPKGKKITLAIVTSPSGWRGLPGGLGYGSSKAALINFIESLRAELGGEIWDFRLVNPGFIKTRLTDKNEFKMPQLMDSDEAAKLMLKGLQTKRFDISFPNPFLFFLKFLRVLPYKIYFWMIGKM